MAQEDWTTELPTEPGWYWLKEYDDDGDEGEETISQVIDSRTKQGLVVFRQYAWFPLAAARVAQWAGPIYTPEHLNQWLRDEGVLQS